MYIFTQHFRVVAAMVIREMQARFGSKPGGYAWAIVDPLAHVSTMTLIFSAFARVPPLGSDFALFFASGYLPFTFYQSMSSFVAGSVRANKSLFSYPVVSPIDAVVARYILQLVTSIVVTIVVMLLCTTEATHLNQLDMGSAIQAVTAASLIGLGVGLINVAMFERFPLYENIFNILNRPLYLISGVIMVPEAMTGPIYDTLMWNPLAHIVMWFRESIYPEYVSPGLSRIYVVECGSVLVMLGLYLFTLSRVLREERF